MGNDSIINAVVPEGVGPAPVKPPSAIGPKVQDNTSGKKAQARTYQDLLKDAYDEDTFEYYTNTELVAVQVCHDSGYTQHSGSNRVLSSCLSGHCVALLFSSMLLITLKNGAWQAQMLQVSMLSCWLVMHPHGELICAVPVLGAVNQLTPQSSIIQSLGPASPC